MGPTARSGARPPARHGVAAGCPDAVAVGGGALADGRPVDGRDGWPAQVAGRPAAELVSYAVIAWVVGRIVATPIDHELGERTRTGAVVHDLLRPGRRAALLGLGCWTCPGRPAQHGAAIGHRRNAALRGRPACNTGSVDCSSRVPHAGTCRGGGARLVRRCAVTARGEGGWTRPCKGPHGRLAERFLVPLDVYPDAITRVARALPFAAMADAPADLLVRGRHRCSIPGAGPAGGMGDGVVLHGVGGAVRATGAVAARGMTASCSRASEIDFAHPSHLHVDQQDAVVWQQVGILRNWRRVGPWRGSGARSPVRPRPRSGAHPAPG